MELRSGRRLRFSQHLADRISALPDDLLLLILARLRCVGTAARTGMLSRRWRNLWKLLSALVFHDVKYSSLEPALACVSPVVSLLEIHVPMEIKFSRTPSGGRGARAEISLGGTGITYLLRAATRLDPETFVFNLASYQVHGYVELPCFNRATSITLESRTFIRFRVLFSVEFPALDTLSLSGYNIGLDALIQQSPRLRVLRLKVFHEHQVAMVRSPSLQELFVDSIGCAHRVDIDAPVLRQLTMSLRPSERVNISIFAPLVETISWRCNCNYVRVAIGRWRINQLKLQSVEKTRQLPSLHIDASICSFSYLDQVANFKKEIKKHMVAAFSGLELHLKTSGHVYGAFVFLLIGMKRIHSVMQRLKIIFRDSKVKEICPTNCGCHPANWKLETVSLIALEEIQIDGFEGEDHEFDFLKLMFNSAPMLRKVIVNQMHADSSNSNGCAELYDLFRSYSGVACYVNLSTSEYLSSIHD